MPRRRTSLECSESCSPRLPKVGFPGGDTSCLFILLYIANVVLTLTSPAILPDRVATHFGAVLFLFLLFVNLLVIDANSVETARLNPRVFLSALAAFLVMTALWAIALHRAFRIPADVNDAMR